MNTDRWIEYPDNDEIEKSIENSKSELENLIFLLPDNITSNNQTETKQIQ